MIIGSGKSKNNVSIRLTQERWLHIITAHPEITSTDYQKVLAVVGNPDIVLSGDTGELLAVKKSSRKHFFVVVYKEVSLIDGFILTAYKTSDVRWLLKRKVIWNKES